MDFPMSVMDGDPMLVNYFWQQCVIGIRDATGILRSYCVLSFMKIF
jgi:hypothetical protein